MDVGSICLCITAGAIICLVFLGLGVCIGNDRCDKEQLHGDSDVRLYVYSRYRNRDSNRSSDKRFSEQEKMNVLNVIRMDYRSSLSRHEKEVLEYLIENSEGDET